VVLSMLALVVLVVLVQHNSIARCYRNLFNSGSNSYVPSKCCGLVTYLRSNY